jgi:hypothetical protein
VKTAGTEWQIPVIVVGVLMVLLLAVVVFICAVKKERQHNIARPNVLLHDTTITSHLTSDSSDTSNDLYHDSGNVTHIFYSSPDARNLAFFISWHQVPLNNRACR